MNRPGGIHVRVSNQGPVKHLRTGFCRLLIEDILARSRRRNAEVSLAFVGDRTMRRLNRRYRGINRTTDVLAFDLSPHEPLPRSKRTAVPGPRRNARPVSSASPIAELVISSETARRQAVRSGHALHREISLLVIHGLLHALGYDHEKPEEAQRMLRRERYLAKTCLKSRRRPEDRKRRA